ncbi:hypothetical protein ABZ383_26360 [Streptomyces sp. NPDC005900]|uniref:hypothetical protein n=1 Tax=Streptomyces sp. NPDC005900 TaxID=3154569 RepID=UPI0033C124ED
MPRTPARTRLFRAGVLTAACAMLTGTALTTSAQAAPVAKPKEKVKVLDWLSVKQSDTRPHHLRVGTDWVIHSHLYTNRKGHLGKKIGDASSHCSVVATDHRGYASLCHRVLRTDDGGISLSDTIDHSGPTPYSGLSAVTGGTGKYREAEGQAEITLHPGVTRYRIMLDD